MKFVINSKRNMIRYINRHGAFCLFILLCFIISPIAWSVTLFDDALYRPLIADHRAFLQGDVLTVLVMETSNAQTSADLASGKKIKTVLEGSYNKDKVELGFGLKGDG